MATPPDIAPEVEMLYAPQFDQLGVTLRPCGCGLYGQAVTEDGSGYGWVMPVGKYCLVTEHSITRTRDTTIIEYVSTPYACLSSISEASAVCMPETGITAHELAAPYGNLLIEDASENLCSFLIEEPESTVNPLSAGCIYHARSIIFLPEFFRELEARYGSEFSGLYSAFDSCWNEPAAYAIKSTLERIGSKRARIPGAGLYVSAAVDALAAELAASQAADVRAKAAQQTRESRYLAEQAVREVERALDEGRAPRIEEVAARLYVSRSRLCAVFKEEMHEGLGAHIRRRRYERAQELLGEGWSVGEVAARLGYPSQTAFSHAFKQACGQSASDWREQHGVRVPFQGSSR